MKNTEEHFATEQSEHKKIYSQNALIAFIQKLWDTRFIRFLFVGVLNTLFGYALYAFLVFIGINYLWARVIAIIIGIIFNFFTTGRIVFNNKDNWLIVRFVLVYAVTMSLDVFVLKRMVEKINLNEYLAGALNTIPIALLSYLLNSVFTFKTIRLFKKSSKDSS